MKRRLTARVVYEYLEEKIINDDYSDDEYQLYIGIKKCGSGVLKDKQNKKVLNCLIKECRDIYRNGY